MIYEFLIEFKDGNKDRLFMFAKDRKDLVRSIRVMFGSFNKLEVLTNDYDL